MDNCISNHDLRYRLLTLLGQANAFNLLDLSDVSYDQLKAAKDTGHMIFEGIKDLLSKIPKEG